MTHTLAGVLVGGASSRFGSDKASALFKGISLLDHHINVLHEAGCETIVYVGGAVRSGVAHGATHVPDAMPGQGPLAGLVALLHHAHHTVPNGMYSEVMMIACDVPLVSPTTVQRVITALGNGDISVASGDRDHWSCLAVRVTQYHTIFDAFQRGARALRDALQHGNVARVPIDERELVNVNDTATLHKALQMVTNSEELGR